MQHPASGHDGAKSAVTFREMRIIVFGSENNDELTGPGKNDWLYGGDWIKETFWKEAA